MYTDLKIDKPKEGDKVWAGVCKKPMNPKIAEYKKEKFYDVSDGIELFPTHWKYPNVL